MSVDDDTFFERVYITFVRTISISRRYVSMTIPTI